MFNSLTLLKNSEIPNRFQNSRVTVPLQLIMFLVLLHYTNNSILAHN